MPIPLTKETIITEDVLREISFTATALLGSIATSEFFEKLSDANFMRIAVYLAEKSYAEGGCPIGGVIIDNATRSIVGKGHNMLVQENNPYNHGETSAMRDAGRIDFSNTTIFTTLSPCDVCATLIYMRGFSRVVVGNITSASGNEELLRGRGIRVEILEDEKGIVLYEKYRKEKPDQDLEDWRGLSAVNQKKK